MLKWKYHQKTKRSQTNGQKNNIEHLSYQHHLYQVYNGLSPSLVTKPSRFSKSTQTLHVAMRIAGSSVERSIKLGELEKGPELDRVKKKVTSRHLRCEIQPTHMVWGFGKKYYSNNFKFKKTSIPNKKSQPNNENPNQTHWHLQDSEGYKGHTTQNANYERPNFKVKSLWQVKNKASTIQWEGPQASDV